MAVLPDRLTTAFLELEELWRADRSKFTVTEVLGAHGVKVTHPAMTREWAARSPPHRGLVLADIEDLETAEAIAIDWGSGPNGRRGDFRLTPSAELAAERLRTLPPRPPHRSRPGGAWTCCRCSKPRTSSSSASGPTTASRRTPSTASLAARPGTQRPRPRSCSSRLLATCATSNPSSRSTGTLFFRLGERALQQVAGWPGAGGDLASELLGLIDQRIADPDVDDDDHSRLVQLRQCGDVGKGVLTGVLTALVKSQTGI